MRTAGKIIAITILLFVTASALYALDTVYAGTKEVTAYKRSYSEGIVPDLTYTIRVIDPDSMEAPDGVVINIPESSRRADFMAFSWVVSGNAYSTVNVDVTFSPMYWEKDTTTMRIPYTVILSHAASRVGNSMIPVGRYPTESAIPINNSFTPYDYNYCDDVEFYEGGSKLATAADSDYAISTTTPVEVKNSSRTITAKYNIAKYTKIYNNGSEVPSYGYAVCDYWNRRSSAYVNLAITDDSKDVDTGELYDNGIYYANVVIEISTDN